MIITKTPMIVIRKPLCDVHHGLDAEYATKILMSITTIKINSK
ncbi:hypothetical protein ACWOBX_00975 [Facklamia languida]